MNGNEKYIGIYQIDLFCQVCRWYRKASVVVLLEVETATATQLIRSIYIYTLFMSFRVRGFGKKTPFLLSLLIQFSYSINRTQYGRRNKSYNTPNRNEKLFAIQNKIYRNKSNAAWSDARFYFDSGKNAMTMKEKFQSRKKENHSIKIEEVLWAEIGKLQEAPIIHRLSLIGKKP